MKFQKYVQLIKNKTQNPVFRNVALISSFVFIAKIISYLKEVVISSTFGLSLFLDTFFVAILVPSFIQNVFVGALKQLFIPNYIKEIKYNKDNASSFQSFVLVSITLLTIILGLIVLLFQDVFLEMLYPQQNQIYYDLVRNQTYVIIPSLLFWGYSSFLSGLLEIESKFKVTSAMMFVQPIIMIVFVLLFKSSLQELTLAAGILSGSILGFLILIVYAHYQKVLNLGKIQMSANIKEMLAQYPAKLSSGMLTGINPFVDQYFAAQLVIGTISAINYGIRIPAFLVSILMISLGNVLLPHFSRVVLESPEKARKELLKILKLVFIGALSISLVLGLFSYEVIEVLLERGKFTNDDTFVVSNIQMIALIYVPFFLCTLICVKYLTVINENKFMAKVSLWNLILNLILNIILVKNLGVYGLVLSTTLVYVVSSFIYVRFALVKSKQINNS